MNKDEQRCILNFVALLLSVFVAVGTAFAEATLPGMAVEFNGWKYIPIFENGDVQSFVILAVEPDPLSANINSMWFIRDGNSWSGYAWRTAVQKEALEDINATLGLADETDAYWPVDPDVRPDGTVPTTTMEPLATGLFEDDPLLPLVESQQDPTVLLSILVSAGWQAADTGLFTSECRLDQLLDGLAAGFALELIEDSAGVDAIGDAIDNGECPGGGTSCTPITITGGVTSSGCIDTTGWIFDNTDTCTPMGGCFPNNHWHGSFFKYENRNVVRTYSDCSTCSTVQVRYNDCTTTVSECDTDYPLNPCTVPLGYTPPAGPSIGSPCSAANSNCEGWTDWSPDIDDVCP